MQLHTFLTCADYLKNTGLAIRPLYHGQEQPSDEDLARLGAVEAAVETQEEALLLRCAEAGFGELFFDCGEHDGATLASLHGKCRYVLQNRGELERLDRTVPSLLSEGYLENVVLRIRQTGDGEDFKEALLPEIARWIRRSDSLAVRGVFLDLRGEENLAEAARRSFSLIKKIRSDLPCILHFFCFEGLLEPLARGDAQLRSALEMLASLNDTSLYAEFLIA